MSLWKPAKSPYWHYDFQLAGRRFHGSTGCAGKSDAKRIEAAKRRAALLGVDAKPAITLDNLFGSWWKADGQHQRNAATMRGQIKRLLAGLGQNSLAADLSLAALDGHIARRRAHVSNATVNREIELIRRVFAWGHDRGFDVARLKWNKLILPEPPERVRALTSAEEQRLFAALPAHLHDMILFALLSGKRRSEVIGLCWNDVDLGGARASFRTKGNQLHVLPLTMELVAIIARLARSDHGGKRA